MGNPLGVLNKSVTSNYGAISTSSNFENLKYIGPATPTFFGSIRNSISYKQVTVSANVTYKLGYYFRRRSVSYSFSTFGSDIHPDYFLRWQKPGDEYLTNVPSMVYPVNQSRDNFYAASEILAEKGDHVRLQDIQFTYDLVKENFKKLPFRSVQLYVYLNNLGILWRANEHNIDPDFNPGATDVFPNPKTYAIGMNINF